MVTIRNDIESNGSANRGPEGTAVATRGVPDGIKNVNHLVNGSRRSTMADLKSKTFNRKCVGFLSLIVCVGVCFGVGMLFLYGHLVDRLDESAISGTMWHDKNGNPVKPVPSVANTTSDPKVVSTTPSASTQTPNMAIATTSNTSGSTTISFIGSSTDKYDDSFELDSKQIPKHEGKDSIAPEIDNRVEVPTNAGTGVRSDDEDDGESSGDSSGDANGNDYADDQPREGSGRRY